MKRLCAVLLFSFSPFLSRPAWSGSPLSLEQAVAQALANNRTIDNVKMSISEARLNFKATRKERLPKLRTNYSYTRTLTDFSISGEYPSELDPSVMNRFTISFPRDNYSWTSWVHMPVLSGMQDLYEEIARLGIDVARVQLVQAQNELIANVKVTYCTLLRDEKLIELASQNLRSCEEHEKLTLRYLREGLVAKSSVMEARVERANSQLELQSSRQSKRMSHATLATLMGLADKETPLVPADTLGQRPWSLTLAQCIQFSRQHNPELVAFAYLKSQASREVKLEKSHLKPTLDFNAGFMKYGDTPGMKADPTEGLPNKTAWAALSVNWLLTDWGQKRTEAKAKKIKLAQVRNNELLAQDRVDLRIRETWTQLETARENAGTALLAIEAARENVRLARLRFAEQTATSKEVIDALTGLKRAEYSHTSALHASSVALARLEETMGTDFKRIGAGQKNDRISEPVRAGSKGSTK
jgi:outer membrane protein TolC